MQINKTANFSFLSSLLGGTCLFLLLFTSYVFAAVGTTKLTSFYPPPTATYTKVNLATNFSPTPSTANPFCTGNNNGATYFDTTPSINVLSVCTGLNQSSPANGTIHTDGKGTLKVIMGGQDIIYPQECYNAFCSYSNNSASNPCINTATNGQPSFFCSAGFTQQMPIDQENDNYDVFTPNADTTILSMVCCSGYSSLGYVNTNLITQTANYTTVTFMGVSAQVPNLTITDPVFQLPNNPVNYLTWSTNPKVIDPTGAQLNFSTNTFPNTSYSPPAGQSFNTGRYFVSFGIGGKMFYFYPSISASSMTTLTIPMPIDLAILPPNPSKGYYGATCAGPGDCTSGICNAKGTCDLPQLTCGNGNNMCNGTTNTCCQTPPSQYCCTNGCCGGTCGQDGNC